MYAIIKTSGKQYKVEVGTIFDVDRVDAEVGSSIVLDKNVLMIGDGDKVSIGKPLVEGAAVTVEVKEHLRGPKLIVFKMKRRKRYRVKKGHRQELTKLEVKEINF